MNLTPHVIALLSVLATASPLISQPRLVNLRTISSANPIEEFVFFTIHEDLEQRDLNSDGDLLDSESFVYASPGGTIRNAPTSRIAKSRVKRVAALTIREQVDLNGDGDSDDSVVHVLDLNTGSLINLALATNEQLMFHGELISIRVEEWRQGQDLNRDGDLQDTVLHAYDITADRLRNLRFASDTVGGGFPLPFLAVEAEGSDYNEDGDTEDKVVHYYDGERVTNLGHAGYGAGTIGHSIVFHGMEDKTDTNGDGDLLDQYLGVHDLRDGTTTYFPYSDYSTFAERWLLIEARETVWQQDLNGDGILRGEVLVLYDLETDRLASLQIRPPRLVRGHPSLLPALVKELDNGDLNGDGDLSDQILHILDSDGTFQNTRIGLNYTNPVVSSGPSGIYFGIREADLGEDRNGDGDVDDFVLHWIDSLERDPVSLEIFSQSRPWVAATDRGAVFLLREEELGGDGNGDGDQRDWILHSFSTATRTVRSHGISASGIWSRGRFVILRADERDEGGLDLNDNGLTNDEVTHILDLGAFPRNGTVNAAVGPSADVLFLNGEAGEDPARVVEYDIGGSLELEMRLPPSLVGTGQTAPYAVYAWADLPTPATQVTLPLGIGTASHLMPLTGHPWAPDLTWNNAGRFRFLGSPDRDSEPAPSTFLHVPSVRRGFRFFLQGVIFDPASAALVPASLTNAIEARPR